MRIDGRTRLILLALCSALAAFSQYSTSDRIILPADKTDAPVTLTLPDQPAKGATVTLLPVTDAAGRALSPQPSIDAPVLSADTLQFHIANLFFWGEARLPVQVSGDVYIYTLQRGPGLTSSDVAMERQKPGTVWLYNFGTQPLTAKWHVISGTESLCGKGVNCASVSTQPQVTIAPASSKGIEFTAPDSWFSPWNEIRKAELELHFGTSETAPTLQVPLVLHLNGHIADAMALWFPWVISAWGMIEHLFWVSLWVTLGAVFLMLAQVMIPNFRRCLVMENQVESLEERLRGISAGVGNRLATRCHEEIQSVRRGLAMGQASTKSRFLTWDGMALSGNTAEVDRLASIMPKIESRIRLTERLDERQTATLDSGTCQMPPSLCWTLDRQLHSVQSILAGQFVTDVDEKNASAILDLIGDPDASLKEFTADLEVRVAGVRRLFANEPWKSKCAEIVADLDLNGCADLLKPDPEEPPPGGWTMDELIRRDLAAVKLSIVNRMISLESLLKTNPAVLTGVREKLPSNDPGKLSDADMDLVKLAQGVSDQDVETALKNGMWDALFEPATPTVTDQDVVRVSLAFRDKRVDRSAAKNTFQCYWSISPDETYEEDWEAQFILARGTVTVQPEVYDATGNKVVIRPSTESDKGIFTFTVGQPPSNMLHARLLRGLLDATITAVVPVITVALTQAQNGGNLGIDKLVLLGFTSQAIRAAVVPESVVPSPPAPAANAKPVARQ